MADAFATVKKHLMQAFTAVPGNSTAREAAQIPLLTGTHSESLLFKEKRCPMMDFLL